MKPARIVANILFYVSRFFSVLFLIITLYALAILLLSAISDSSWIPIEIESTHFKIFFPFTRTTFLLGDYTAAYLITNLFTIAFYALFLWLLSGVFHAFRQQKLFTKRGVTRLSQFYMTNLAAPVVFVALLLFWREESSDIARIILLHLVIGIFAFFMAAIFKQGLLLQEEQDLTF
jgi:hypothetical protein